MSYVLSLVQRKLGIMLVRKVSSQMSLFSPHRLIREDTLSYYGIFRSKEVPDLLVQTVEVSNNLSPEELVHCDRVYHALKQFASILLRVSD